MFALKIPERKYFFVLLYRMCQIIKTSTLSDYICCPCSHNTHAFHHSHHLERQDAHVRSEASRSSLLYPFSAKLVRITLDQIYTGEIGIHTPHSYARSGQDLCMCTAVQGSEFPRIQCFLANWPLWITLQLHFFSLFEVLSCSFNTISQSHPSISD